MKCPDERFCAHKVLALPDDDNPDDKRLPDDEARRIAAAIHALTPQERAMLYRYAQFKLLGASARLRDFDLMDLFQEAVMRTWEGTRVWNPEISFVLHLKGCIRSIADERFKAARQLYALECELQRELHKSTPVDHESWDAAGIFGQLRNRLKGDSVALGVLESILEGDSAAETRRKLNMEANVYNAARKRIVRRLEEIAYLAC